MTDPLNSYVCGTANAPLLGDTIGSALDRAVARWGDREALVSPSHDVRWTWRDFAARVDAVAAGFLALGLEPGARIGVWSLNRPEWTLTQFAAARAGLILVTINPAYRLSELEFALGKVIGAVQRDGGGEQADVVGGLAHQPVQHGLVHLLIGHHRIGDAMGRVLIEVQTRRAKGQVQIKDQRVLPQRLGNGPGDVVADGG